MAEVVALGRGVPSCTQWGAAGSHRDTEQKIRFWCGFRMNRDGGNNAATGRTLVLCRTDSCTMGLICSSRSLSIMAVISDVTCTLELQMWFEPRASNGVLELQL